MPSCIAALCESCGTGHRAWNACALPGGGHGNTEPQERGGTEGQEEPAKPPDPDPEGMAGETRGRLGPESVETRAGVGLNGGPGARRPITMTIAIIHDHRHHPQHRHRRHPGSWPWLDAARCPADVMGGDKLETVDIDKPPQAGFVTTILEQTTLASRCP